MLKPDGPAEGRGVCVHLGWKLLGRLAKAPGKALSGTWLEGSRSAFRAGVVPFLASCHPLSRCPQPGQNGLTTRPRVLGEVSRRTFSGGRVRSSRAGKGPSRTLGFTVNRGQNALVRTRGSGTATPTKEPEEGCHFARPSSATKPRGGLAGYRAPQPPGTCVWAPDALFNDNFLSSLETRP